MKPSSCKLYTRAGGASVDGFPAEITVSNAPNVIFLRLGAPLGDKEFCKAYVKSMKRTKKAT